MVGRAARIGVGLALGALSAVAELLLLVPALLAPHRSTRLVHAAVAGERRRSSRWLGAASTPREPAPARETRYLAARVPVGLLGGAVLAALGLGTAFAVLIVGAWLTGIPWGSTTITGRIVAWYVLPGVVLLYLGLAGAAGIASWERRLLLGLDAPTAAELQERVDAVVAAVDDERRRIERDLHDGVQQRLVALGMLLGRARRYPDRPELVEQAHAEAQRALVELRDVSWRVYPAALDTDGLAAALESIAERAPLPVVIHATLDSEPPPAPRAVAWFVVCEAVTNAAKHADAGRVDIALALTGGRLTVGVTDDGRGGADPDGGGLTGLARRVRAAGGTLRIASPPGGPTTVDVVLPCA